MSKPTPTPAPAQDRPKKRWLAYFGVNSLVISVLLHVLFGVGATYMIVQHFQKKKVNFHATEPPSQHTEVEHKVELAKKNNVESAPPDLKRIVTTDVSAITLPEPPVVPSPDDATPSAMSGVDGVMGSGLGGGNGTGGTGGGMPLFGAPDGSGLQGYFYDLKQTSDKRPTNMNEGGYLGLLAKYVREGWNDAMLDPFYRSKTPLYSNVFAISTRPSEEAPKAFGLENEVQAGLWIVHYHGKVGAPKAGDYRLAGFGDNVLMVKINGATVLDGGWDSLSDKADLHGLLPFTFPSYIKSRTKTHIPNLKIGPSFHMDAAATVDMDVLIGDSGGVCSFFLLIEKEGAIYANGDQGSPEYPFFQLSTKDAPTFSSGEEHPTYGTTPEPWQIVTP